MAADRPRTLGELIASGFRIESVKDEMRRNLIAKLLAGEALFPESWATKRRSFPRFRMRSSRSTTFYFWACVVRPRPGCSASLSGCWTTRCRSSPARRFMTTHSRRSRSMPATWSPRRAMPRRSSGSAASDRYHEKLATPDVTIADLIGEVDMIKHAEGRYLSSELTMHFGLIPRTNRGIFCINELPDLAPKIQVGLFNVLEERDVQIRGYPVRLDLDLCMVFSANPEDYTNRGRIVTPLKDRIGSVIRTHYPLTREIGIAISDQNAWLERGERHERRWRSRSTSRRLLRRSRDWPGRRRTSTSSRACRCECRSRTWKTSSQMPNDGPSCTASAGSSRGYQTLDLPPQARAASSN